MSPRRNYRRRPSEFEPLDEGRARRGVESAQEWPDGAWTVRSVPGEDATKIYRCPGCDQEIRPGTAHVVAWPADWRGNEGDRRHWHWACWRARDHRTPGWRRKG